MRSRQSRRLTQPGPALAAIVVAACAAEDVGQQANVETPNFRLVDVSKSAGLRFTHQHAGTGQKYFPETMGSGATFLDYDGDGLIDIYLVNSAPTPEFTGPSPESVLFRNQGDGTFAPVAGLLRSAGYAMGAIAADYDNDGDADLYVTTFGRNRLFRNTGSGSFEEVSERAGVDDPLWSTGATFVDVDADGWLDLYVANYVDFDYDNHKYCGSREKGVRAYCHPDVYNGVVDRLYLSNRDGTFRDATAANLSKTAAGWERDGKGLGVIAGDYDLDGDLDIFVANDSTPNFLWSNDGTGHFEDVALLSGVALNEDGKTEACMGVDLGDVDGNGFQDLMVTNLDFETNTLYMNRGDGLFAAQSFEYGIARPSMLNVGFGTDLLDLDNDGWLDLVVVNGHIIDNVSLVRDQVTYAQPEQVLWNRSGEHFVDVSPSMGDAITTPSVSRGLASADIDLDGDLDLVVTRNDDDAALLRNELDGGARFVRLRLEGRSSPRDPIGARAVLSLADRDLHVELSGASSYLSRNEPVLHLGLGSGDEIRHLSLYWPSGRRARLVRPPANRTLVFVEAD